MLTTVLYCRFATTWILHLSDLHLGSGSDAPLNDAKLRIEPSRERLSKQKVFRYTLGTVRGLAEELGKPDVVALSGDLTYQAAPDGFDAFLELLSQEGDVFPDDHARIVVVPGNHDVVWDAEPGTEMRYEGFLRATREAGCTTPLLDGVDFVSEGGGVRFLEEADEALHALVTPELVVVPINSSNWCGVIATDPGRWTVERWEKELSPIETAARRGILDELRRMRQYDLARVSRQQIDALRRLFERLGVPESAADDRLRVAVIHHQLLPVSTREEVKAFESIINLGFVREVLREFGFHLVLHGHKHDSGIHWDVGRLRNEAIRRPERRILVVAGPGNFGPDKPVLRTIEIQGAPAARVARIRTIGGTEREGNRPITLEDVEIPLWLAQMELDSDLDSDGVHFVSGANSASVYLRVRSLFETRDARKVFNLHCEITSPEGADELPPAYPRMGDEEERQKWFRAFVEWWQLDRPVHELKLLPFRHGQRIHDHFGNQLERAARVLVEEPESTKGLIVLAGPSDAELKEGQKATFQAGPAFAVAQLLLVRVEPHSYRLDCLGYFRKQEMQFWWPINVAELALIQSRVLAILREQSEMDVIPGRLATFASLALYGKQLPKELTVPEIDLAAADPKRSVRLASAISNPRDESEATLAAEEWGRMLDELRQPLADGTLRVPQIGPAQLLRQINVLSMGEQTETAKGVCEALETLGQLYREGETKVADAKRIEEIIEQVERTRAAVLTSSRES